MWPGKAAYLWWETPKRNIELLLFTSCATHLGLSYRVLLMDGAVCYLNIVVGKNSDETGRCVNRKRSESMFCTISAVLHSPWSLSIAVLILLLSVELVDTRSSLEPWQTTKTRFTPRYRALLSCFSQDDWKCQQLGYNLSTIYRWIWYRHIWNVTNDKSGFKNFWTISSYLFLFYKFFVT